ncbi:MAG: NUDIX domain-containing protein [Actinobacteria bacterium]|nr:NUDIX domain-containing protein [Actinomycetota bacterium]
METVRRESARIALVDGRGRVLLLHAVLPGEEWWELPGGGVEPSEMHRDAALRELVEETGISVEDVELLGAVDTEFEFDGRWYHQRETVLRADHPGTGVELRNPDPPSFPRHVEYRWWEPLELRATAEHIHPPQLAELLGV